VSELEAYLNPASYMLIDKLTGEEIPLEILIKEVEKKNWEKVYAGVLAEYIEAPGDSSCLVLAYLIKERNRDNVVLGTHRSLAKDIGVGHATVTRILKVLQKKGFIKKIRNGQYMVSPKMIRYGSYNAGVALITLWENSNKLEK